MRALVAPILSQLKFRENVFTCFVIWMKNVNVLICLHFSLPWKMDSENEAPKDPGVCQQRYTEQDYEGDINLDGH